MRRVWVLTGALLCVTPVVADEIFDAVYVSKPSACERAFEEDFNAVLREEQAWAIYPSKGILGGELVCFFHQQQQVITGSAFYPEMIAIARCMYETTNFIDQVAVTPSSFNINISNGEGNMNRPAGDKVEVISIHAESEPPDNQNYAGIYTRCDDATEGMLEWFE
ncbi:MAG: hypothetical protein WBA73_01110 [Devosia sp.]